MERGFRKCLFNSLPASVAQLFTLMFIVRMSVICKEIKIKSLNLMLCIAIQLSSVSQFPFLYVFHFVCSSFLIHPLFPIPSVFQTTDDLLVASAECPSDDEDIDPCEPSSGGLG